LTEAEAAQALKDLLGNLGVGRGDLVYLGVDMGRLPLPDYPADLSRASIQQREQKWCAFVLRVITDFLGPSGTILGPTFTYSCSKTGSRFVVEETPSEAGPFTEHLRRQPGAERSVHPLFSVAGIGPLAKSILGSTGNAAFGASSPFGMLSQHSCKFLCLGVPLRWCFTYIHHLEQTYGCNNRYNKVFEPSVIRAGKELSGPWLAYVAFRSIQSSVEVKGFEEALREDGSLAQEMYRGHPSQCVGVDDVNRVGYKMLEANSCAFMSANVEVVLDESRSMTKPVSGDRAVFLMEPNPNG
jgi:aminoglycoside N3'-acetyltransferase